MASSIASKIIFHYNDKIRIRLNPDLRKLEGDFKNKFPYEALPDLRHLNMGLDWLMHTNELLGGQGFPTKFNVRFDYGLGPSYPETTGYTLCTLLTILRNDVSTDTSPVKICKAISSSYNFLLNCQLESGGFTGGHKKLKNFGQPSLFNTGQILLGLSDLLETLRNEKFAYAEEFKHIDQKQLEESIVKGASFLSTEQESDGSYHTRYAYSKSRKTTYYGRSTYGLLRAGIVLNRDDFKTAAEIHFKWVLTQKQDSGWINNWGFEDEWSVLHGISYTLRGLIEAFLHFGEPAYLDAVLDGIEFITRFDQSAFPYPDLVPSYHHPSGEFNNELCITGLSQLAIVLAKIPEAHHTAKHRELFDAIVQQTKRFQCRGFKNPSMNGVMPASYPLHGKYQPYDLIEWGTKFFMDSLLLNMGVNSNEIKG